MRSRLAGLFGARSGALVSLLIGSVIAAGLAAPPASADVEGASLEQRIRALRASVPAVEVPIAKAMASAEEPAPVTGADVVRAVHALPGLAASLRATSPDEASAVVAELTELLEGEEFQEAARSVALGLAWIGDTHLEAATGQRLLSWAVQGVLDGELSMTAGFWETFGFILTVAIIVGAVIAACVPTAPACVGVLAAAAASLLAESVLLLAALEQEARASKGQVKFTATCPGVYLCAADNIGAHTLDAADMEVLAVRFFPTGRDGRSLNINGYGCYNATGGAYTPFNEATINACFTRTVVAFQGVVYEQKPRNAVYDNSIVDDATAHFFACAPTVMIQVIGFWDSGGRASNAFSVAKQVPTSGC